MNSYLSNVLIRILCFEYLFVMVVCLFEKRWATALYWLGASILNTGVLLGMR